MIFPFLAALVVTTPTDHDVRFHNWCQNVGIETPLAQLRTTPESVAGRGVFAHGNDIPKGSVVIRIPEKVVLNQDNAAKHFPQVAKQLQRQKDRHKTQQRQESEMTSTTEEEESSLYTFSSPADWWMAELTCYSVACMEEEGDHVLWKPWIKQWQRDDPMQRLYETGATLQDTYAIDACVAELRRLLPSVSHLTMSVAIDIRLGRLEELQKIFGLLSTSKHLAMYGILGSRAVTLTDDNNNVGTVAVIPMHDMINHSTNQPNLDMSFDGKYYELKATTDIPEGQELFLNYNHNRNNGPKDWDEHDAAWTLVQWGIAEKPNSSSKVTDRRERRLPYPQASQLSDDSLHTPANYIWNQNN